MTTYVISQDGGFLKVYFLDIVHYKIANIKGSSFNGPVAYFRKYSFLFSLGASLIVIAKSVHNR